LTLASLLDTNIVSQRIKQTPEEGVVRWLSHIPQQDTFLSVITIQELRTGIELLPAGRKRRNLESWLNLEVRPHYAGRILPITEDIADIAGKLIAKGKKAGSVPDMADALIAATALVHGMSVATINQKHFERLGVELVRF
jgi:predicted nucleic acid-binding protein